MIIMNFNYYKSKISNRNLYSKWNIQITLKIIIKELYYQQYKQYSHYLRNYVREFKHKYVSAQKKLLPQKKI